MSKFENNHDIQTKGSTDDAPIAGRSATAEDIVVEYRPRHRNHLYLPSRVRSEAAAIEFCTDLSRISTRRILLALDRFRTAVFLGGKLQAFEDVREVRYV